MALDTNIAMGIKPVEQPNMLGQMAQVMAIRQAQQGYESQNALSDAYQQAYSTGGGKIDPNTIYKNLANSGQGHLIPKAQEHFGKIAQEQAALDKNKLEAASKRIEILGASYGGLVKNPTLEYAKNMFEGLIATGAISKDEAAGYYTKLAANPDPKSIAALALQAENAAISAKEKMTDATSRAINAATVGASMYGHNVSAANSQRTDTRERSKLHFLTGDNGFYGVNQYSGTAIPVGMAPPPPQAQPPVTNALANPATASTIINAPVNSLLPTVQSQPGAPTVNNAAALSSTLRPPPRAGYEYDTQGKQVPLFDPKKVARESTNSAGDVTQYNERGGIIGVVPNAGKPSAAHEKELVTEAKKAEGQQTVQTLVASLADQYKGLLKEGGITSTAKGSLSNIGARSGSSAVGQFAAGFVGTKAQELRDSIAQTRPLIINAIKDSTGMSAQQLNSNVELQNFLKAATDPTLSIEANLKALNNLSKLYGLGKELTMDDMRGTTTAPSTALPKGYKED